MNKKRVWVAGVALFTLGNLFSHANPVQAAETAQTTIQKVKNQSVVNLNEIVENMNGTIKTKEDDRGSYTEYVVKNIVIQIYPDKHIAFVNGVEESFYVKETSKGLSLPMWAPNPVVSEKGIAVAVEFVERFLEVTEKENTLSYVKAKKQAKDETKNNEKKNDEKKPESEKEKEGEKQVATNEPQGVNPDSNEQASQPSGNTHEEENQGQAPAEQKPAESAPTPQPQPAPQPTPQPQPVPQPQPTPEPAPVPKPEPVPEPTPEPTPPPQSAGSIGELKAELARISPYVQVFDAGGGTYQIYHDVDDHQIHEEFHNPNILAATKNRCLQILNSWGTSYWGLEVTPISWGLEVYFP